MEITKQKLMEGFHDEFEDSPDDMQMELESSKHNLMLDWTTKTIEVRRHTGQNPECCRTDPETQVEGWWEVRVLCHRDDRSASGKVLTSPSVPCGGLLACGGLLLVVT